jgi:nucleotide-binding universal stress UspA family protein
MNIIVGTDGKANSEKAVDWALVFARAVKANVYAMYVVDPKQGEEKDKSIKYGMRVLGRVKIKAADVGVDTATLLEAGDPAATLMMAAEQLDAEAIIIGTPERTGGLLRATVTDQVYKSCKCTIIVVK